MARESTSADLQERDDDIGARQVAGRADRNTVVRHFFLALGLITGALWVAALLAR